MPLQEYRGVTLSLNKVPETTMCKVIDQMLLQVVGSARAPKVYKGEMQSLMRTESVADITIQSVLSNMRLTVPILDTGDRIVDRAGM